MHKLANLIKKYRWAILSGVLVGTTYIPFPPWALLFCYVPLWVSILKQEFSIKETLLAGWWTQFVLTLIGFHWIAYTAKEFGGFPWSLSILALLLFCTFFNIYIALSAAAVVALRKKLPLGPGRSLLLLAISHSLIERFWPNIFPWNLGYTLLWAKLPAYQWADVIGFLGLSTLILLLNALMGSAFFMTKRKWLRPVLALGIFATLNFTGNDHKTPWDEFDSEVPILLVQSNIGNLEKVYAEKGRGYQTHIIQKFLGDSYQGLQKYPQSELLMWPETAIPVAMDTQYLALSHQRLLAQGLTQLKKPLLAGAYSKDDQILDRDKSVFNSIFILSENGVSLSAPYKKTHLLAFGEYLPLSDQFPILLQWLPFISNFGRGHGPEILNWPRPLKDTVRFGPQVCYEGLYTEFSRSLALKGAQILINVTNDSWFGYPFEPYQHLYMTLARGIETRRPVLRSTNTGISTGIYANGERLQDSSIHETWVGMFNIKYLQNPPQTIYVKWGHWDWLLWLSVAVALILGELRHARTAKP